MNEIINEFFEKEYQEIKKVHQIKPLFERYKNMSKEMVSEYQQEYSKPINLIVSALYCADYVITSSEVKFEMRDDIRRKEIIEFWQKISFENENEWYDFTHLVAFVFKIASILRKRYHYLLDRGIAKHIASALVSDYYSRHLIQFVSEKIALLPIWWIAYLFETALCQSIFSKTKQKWENQERILKSKERGMIAQIIGNHFIKEIEGEPNIAVPIPYFKESTLFYYFTWEKEGKKGSRFESLLPNVKANQLAKQFKKAVPEISSKAPHLLKYLRLANKTKSIPTGINLFIVHAKTAESEGWFGLLSPLDDINLKEIEALLQYKLEDLNSFERFSKNLEAIDILQRRTDEREIVEEEIEKEKKKVGFFKRLFSIFKKKKKVTESKVVKRVQPIDSWARLILDELLIATVSGIGIGEEVYDTFRENNFIISGLIESQLKTTIEHEFYAEEKEFRPTRFYSETSIYFPSEFLDPIISFVEIAKNFILSGLNQEVLSIIPEEALFDDKENPELFRLVEFVMSETRLIGILAEKHIQTVQSIAKPEPIYQRRSILRKANEILTARRVNAMLDVGRRLLTNEIAWDSVKESYEDKPLFFLKKIK